MQHILKIPFLLGLFLFVSCGNSSEDEKKSSGGINQNETIRADGSNIEGTYSTVLHPLNKNIHMNKVGIAAVQREGDNFSAFVKMKSGQRGTTFRQAIYTGRRCPDIKDDLNKDAYVDLTEALVAIGKIVIPLDNNIDSQAGGMNSFPTGDASSGSFFYKVSASFDRMFADLKTPDANPHDNIIKLGPDEGLTFPGRIVFIQGVNPKVVLPPTVRTVDGEDLHKTLPVACGVMWKVDALPAELVSP